MDLLNCLKILIAFLGYTYSPKWSKFNNYKFNNNGFLILRAEPRLYPPLTPPLWGKGKVAYPFGLLLLFFPLPSPLPPPLWGRGG